MGEWRDDHRIGILCSFIDSTVKSIFSKKGQAIDQRPPTDFMPDWAGDLGKMEQKQSVESLKATLLSIAKEQNELFARKERAMKSPPPKEVREKMAAEAEKAKVNEEEKKD